jgi:hypothetical protein
VSVAINGKPEEIPGLATRSFLDPGGPPRTARVNPRKHAPTGIVWHMVIGEVDAHVILGPDGAPAVATSDHGAEALARRTAKILAKRPDGTRPAMASEHLIISNTGLVYCIADLATDVTWHASGCNPHTIGIEIFQAEDGPPVFSKRKGRDVPRMGVYLAAYVAAVALGHWLCERFDVPKRYPMRGGAHIKRTAKALMQDGRGPAGKGWPGTWGHHHSTDNRGFYDPGPVLPEMLIASGFAGVDPDA